MLLLLLLYKGGTRAPQRLTVLVLVLVTVLDFVQSSLFLSCKVLFILRLKWPFLLFPFSLHVLRWEPHGKLRAGFSLGSGGAGFSLGSGGAVRHECQTAGAEPTQLAFSKWN